MNMDEIKEKIKSIITILAIVVCSFSMIFTTFGGKGDAIQLKLSFWGTNLPYEMALKSLAAKYNDMQSEYEVVISKEDAGNYRTWMGARLAGGNASDILATTKVYADQDAANGYLYDLTEALSAPNPYNSGDREWKEDFAGTYLQQVAYVNDNSTWYCVPTDTVSVRFAINTDMLTARGIEIPDENWTFSDFRKICEVFEAEGITGLEIANAKYINYMVSWLIDIFMAQLKYEEILQWDVNGNNQVEAEEIVRLFLEGDAPYDLSKDNAFNEVMRFLKTWSKYWGAGFNSRGDTSENFLRQSVPMMFCGSWGVSGIELTLSNENPEADKTNPYKMFNYISLPVPRLRVDNYLTATESFTFTSFNEEIPLQELGEPSGCFCVPMSTYEAGKAEAAIDFLQFMLSEEGAKHMAIEAYGIPVVKDIQISDKMNDYLPIDGGETVRMRFNLLNLSDGVAEEYHFKQVQMYLMDGEGSISLNSLVNNVQNKYLDVVRGLNDDNGWEW